MTPIQEILWEVEWAYAGNPYYVPGHAIYTALARRLPDDVANELYVSPGLFVPGEYGSFPPTHSHSGGVPYLGTGLRPVEAYDDLFLFRDSTQPWLATTRPRDAHNTHTIDQYGDRLSYAGTRVFGKRPEKRASKRTMSWYIYAYCDFDGQGQLPLADETLDGLQLGGGRNYGFGEVSCVETRTVDLDDLSYARLEDADAYQLELHTPYVLESEYPGAHDNRIPWWWADTDLREREVLLHKGDDTYRLRTIDHGQVVEYTGSDPIGTAKRGVLGVGTHKQYGFGQFRVRPASDDRVPERQAASTGGAE